MKSFLAGVFATMGGCMGCALGFILFFVVLGWLFMELWALLFGA